MIWCTLGRNWRSTIGCPSAGPNHSPRYFSLVYIVSCERNVQSGLVHDKSWIIHVFLCAQYICAQHRVSLQSCRHIAIHLQVRCSLWSFGRYLAQNLLCFAVQETKGICACDIGAPGPLGVLAATTFQENTGAILLTSCDCTFQPYLLLCLIFNDI